MAVQAAVVVMAPVWPLAAQAALRLRVPGKVAGMARMLPMEALAEAEAEAEEVLTAR